MASEGNGMSDLRIGEAVIKDVIEGELKVVRPEDSNRVPPLTPLTMEPKTEQEQKMVTQLGNMIRIIGDRVKDDKEFQDAIDGIAHNRGTETPWARFRKVAEKVFEHGINWERIAVLFYVAGRLALRIVEAHLPESVSDVLRWTVDFFRNNLLSWIRDHGGWINSFTDLASASMQSVSLSPHSCHIMLIFVTGLVVGSFFTWRLTRH